ncbi:hypothetical protein A3Q56_08217 [Intoshia linei]|uniref:Uncharacterized protein n=1 Tax=Intoshia linei TaxID=1819745 RepID=A0A177APY4_9BILA|nr:hypothetical protein A3Q56_08217 [Intoshia linei]
MNGTIHSLSWNNSGDRMAFAVDSIIYYAVIKKPKIWGLLDTDYIYFDRNLPENFISNAKTLYFRNINQSNVIIIIAILSTHMSVVQTLYLLKSVRCDNY